jgi:hypothetical protein
MKITLQLVGDAMNLYNVDVRAVKRLGDFSAALVIAAKQKFRRGSEADSLQSILCEHSRRMDETLDEEAHKGYFSLIAILFIVKTLFMIIL